MAAGAIATPGRTSSRRLFRGAVDGQLRPRAKHVVECVRDGGLDDPAVKLGYFLAGEHLSPSRLVDRKPARREKLEKGVCCPTDLSTGFPTGFKLRAVQGLELLTEALQVVTTESDAIVLQDEFRNTYSKETPQA